MMSVFHWLVLQMYYFYFLSTRTLLGLDIVGWFLGLVKLGLSLGSSTERSN